MKCTSMKWWMPIVVFAVGIWTLPAMAQTHVLADFTDLSLELDPESYCNDSEGFTSGDLDFNNSFTDWGGGITSWDGWSYSNTTDTTTVGNTNQYSAITGCGYGDSSVYGVAYSGFSDPPTITPATGIDGGVLHSMMVTNTTYAYLSMRDGDAFAKKFGGDTGNDTDWFKLIVEGFNNDVSTGTLEFYLADYRFADNSEDYIVDEWTEFDLTSLGYIDKLEFSWDSSDVGLYGINTPTYVALGQVTAVPEPATVALIVSGALALLWWWRRRRNA